MQMQNKPLIAVVSTSGIFPKAFGNSELWDRITHKIDTTIDIPAERWVAPFDRILHSVPEPDKAYSKRACLVQSQPHLNPGYELAPEILSQLDPLHQWTLLAAQQALTDCHMDSLDKSRIGVILAAIALPTDVTSSISRRILQRQFLDPQTDTPAKDFLSTGEALSARVVSMPAALVAKAFGLGGGSYTLDAACASSLYAVKLACDALQAYRTDAMVAGGVSRPDCLYTQVGFSQLRALSPSGRCAPFDQSADGLVVGEGVGIIVLKRLEDALQHADTILGVIRGIGLSNDRRGNLLAPESAGQLRAMRMAYAQAQWQPQDVDYIECHGAGTPVGDATELDSLQALWGDRGWQRQQCAIGSVKSMLGHLLTAAGAAGMIKTLLSLHHKTLPPSLKFEKPAKGSPLEAGPFRVQTHAEPWLQRDDTTPLRAAVSAFGFGGINAHVLLEAFTPVPESNSSGPITLQERTTQSEPVAIVGIELCLGKLASLKQFQEAIFNGKDALIPPPKGRWKAPETAERLFKNGIVKGGFIDQIDVAIGEFQIPPDEIPQLLPQQLLMLKVAAAAMYNAGLPLRQARDRMGAIIGIGFDYEACNFDLRWALPKMVSDWQPPQQPKIDAHTLDQWLQSAASDCGPPLTATRTLGALGGIVASRIAREFRLGGPSFVVSAEEASGLRALEIGAHLLQSRQLDAVLVGAVDLFCDERNLATLAPHLPFSANATVRPFDKFADGTLPGEGAVALVLKRSEDALADKDRIYALVQGIGSASGGGIDTAAPSAGAYRASLTQAMAEARIGCDAISLFETHGSGIPSQDRVEAESLHEVMGSGSVPMAKSTAIGTLNPLVGHTGAASGLAALAKTAISLHHQIIPPACNYSSAAHPQWQNGPFYMPHQAAYWIRNRNQGPRHAGVAAMTSDGNCMHVILQEAPDQVPDNTLAQKRPMGALPYGLFHVAAHSPEQLLASLDELTKLLQKSVADPMEQLACQWHHQSYNQPPQNHSTAIVADSFDHLQSQLAKARQAVVDGTAIPFGRNGGLCYTPQFSARQQQIAFIYPGSGNHYVGMGSTLGAHWPEVLRDMDAATLELRSQMLPQWYAPWRTEWSADWQQQAYQDLIADPLNPIFGQVLFGSHMTGLLKRFNLRPDAVIGYSLGESAGLFANGAWSDRGQMLQRLERSDLFRTQLVGPCHALRQAWQLTDDQAVNWQVAVVNRSAASVDAAIARLAHVRRLIVNTPDQCVIGGLQSEVKTAIEQLNCNAVFLDGVVTVHCDAAQPVAEAYRDLHRFDTTPVDGIRFYSCALEQAYDLTSESTADSILQQALHGFDFPRTIEQAYADGVRLFLEVGPHASCTGMISQILKGKPHLAVAANHRNEDENLTLLKCLGTLLSAGVPVDLNALYGDGEKDPIPAVENVGDTLHVPVGNGPLRIRPLPEASKAAAPAANDPPKSIGTPTRPPSDDVTPIDDPSVPDRTAMMDLQNIISELNDNSAATAKAHQAFLDLSREMTEQFGQTLSFHNQLVAEMAKAGIEPAAIDGGLETPGQVIGHTPSPQPRRVDFDRDACMEFAIGSVGKILGPQFNVIDTYPARVRLPDEPLMLVDRILLVEGEMLSLSSGRVVTEHDVLPGAWYLDGDRAPVCISVEAGQADLFLCAYLGIDHHVKGERTYRLLDAKIRFHRGLPRPGDTIRYDIHIDKFVRQEETYLFFFRFEGYIGDQHLITMTHGCAGFFTAEEVRHSGGIILTDDDLTEDVHIDGAPYVPLLPLVSEAYDDEQVDALRQGDAARCLGALFEGIQLPPNLCLPGGRMALIHRILSMDPKGGRFGLGYIKAEADIHPDDWFLTCHFVDDKVMPGTLMYECCAHTLRVLLLRLGWVTDNRSVSYEPLHEVECRLKCRGPVTPQTRHVHYAVEIKSIGYHPEPYVIADAHMTADDHYIVFFKNMSLQMSGITGDAIDKFWRQRKTHSPNLPPEARSQPEAGSLAPLFSREHILAFAIGRPSQAFGQPYEIFDEKRKIARLPGPPYCFMDRVVAIAHDPWVLAPGGWVEAQYDVPAQAWYFEADGSGVMPFCVLLEIALQPCGWLAAYAGSALKSQNDLKFRNLGGQALLHHPIFPQDQTLTMRTRITQVSEAADMIIEHFDFEVHSEDRQIYTGSTYFGFFTESALAQQVGLREAVYHPTAAELSAKSTEPLDMTEPLTPDSVLQDSIFQPQGLRLPSKALLMIDGLEIALPAGGPNGLGFYRGYKIVDPDEWFFKAHFFQDPVCPGSLGIESFLQLLKFAALQRWPELETTHRFEMVCNHTQKWSYRGQVIPTNAKVRVDAVITEVQKGEAPSLMAEGYLQVDGIYIYKMEKFGIRLVPI